MMTKLIRRYDWDIRFTEYIADSVREAVVLDWNDFNCASWVADGIIEMTGVDLYEDFRDLQMGSPAGTYKAIRAKGFESLDDIVLSRLPEKGLVFLQRGDVCLVPASTSLAHGGQASDRTASSDQEVDYCALGMPNAIALVDPPFAWNITPEGVGRIPLSEAVRAFAVG
jgi:hypothetical protein